MRYVLYSLHKRTFSLASGHPDRRQENPEIQAGKSRNVRLGNPGTADIPACL